MSRQFASVIVMRASEAELDKNEANGVPRQPGDSVRFDDICYGNYDTECLVDVALKAVDHGESVATKAALDDFYSHIREYNSSLSGEMKGMLAKVLDLPIQKPSGGDGMMAVTLVNNPDEILKKMDAGGAKPLDNAVKPADVADVKNFVADMVYSDDMLFMELSENVNAGAKMREALAGLSADDFGRRILMLAAASKRVADELSRASAEGDGSAADSAQDSKGGDFMWV